MYGIEEVGPNIKEDLTAVIQKKLDDKVVEAISIMLVRNPRCQLTSEDVQFLQKSGSQPSTTLRYKVHTQLHTHKKKLFRHSLGTRNGSVPNCPGTYYFSGKKSNLQYSNIFLNI